MPKWMCLIFINVDGMYGVFPCWTWYDALSYGSLALPFFDCCFCCTCGSIHSSKDSFLDKHLEALHRLLWGATKVSIWITKSNIWTYLNMQLGIFLTVLKWLLFIFGARDCAKNLVNLHATAPESKLRAVYKKFSSSDCCSVALRSPAKHLTTLS